MTSKLSHLTAALYRLVSWRGQTPVPDLPNELIFQEILPYLRDDTPTSLAGLQVAFTCKAFYQVLYPCVAQFFINRIVEAYPQHWKLSVSLVGQPVTNRMDIQRFRRRVKAAYKQCSLEHLSNSVSAGAPNSFDSPFRLSYYVHLGSFDDIDLLWALISLLSKPHVSKFLRKLEITLADNDAVRLHTEDTRLVNASEKWKRAFVKLMNTATEVEGIELDLSSLESIDRGPEETLGNPPSPSTLLPTSRLRELELGGRVLSLFWHQYLNSLVSQSTYTLTRLCIYCFDTPQAKWQIILSKWHLPLAVLEDLEIGHTAIPLTTLTSFLLLNPYISSAFISMPSGFIPPGARFPMRPEDYSRFLPRLRKLTATTDILLALFTPWQSASERDIPLYNLESLTILKQEANTSTQTSTDWGYDDITRVLLYAPGSKEPGKQSRISLRAITVEFPGEIAAVERWLESASPTQHRPTERPSEGALLSTVKSVARVASRFLLASPTPPPNLPTILSSLTQISYFGLKIKVDDCVQRFLGLRRPGFSFHPYTVAGFMAGLPAVKEVALDGLFTQPRKAVKDADEFWGALGSMWAECGALETLEIRGLGASGTPLIWNVESEEPTPGFAAWDFAFAHTNN